MLELYQFEECPYCRRVRTKLTDLGMTYVIHNVSRDKGERDELQELTGQRGVPTLIDKEKNVAIVDDDEKIIEYLESNYTHL